ncbi:MAG: metal-dependent hydrolase [Flavipsychrobacter sp.]
MQLTYYGHACFSVVVGGKTLLFDPFISGNDKAQHVDIEQIKADYILQSHGHEDHIADLLPIAKRTGAKVVAMAEIAGWVQAQGYDNVHAMNYGAVDMEFGEVRMVIAGHSSSLPDGSNGGNPAGFVIKPDEGSFYYAGDTCLMMDMQLIPRFATIDFAVMPIGGNFTMNAADAIIASDFIKCDKIIGVHYDTWPPISIDKDKAKQAFTAAGKQLILPEIGETLTV